MNAELKKLYENYWVKLLDEVDSLLCSNPLLIKVSDEYIDSDVKVMIVGQETDGYWLGELNQKEKSVSDLMTGYFNYFYQISTGGKKRGKRAFWNKKNYKYFEDELTKYFKENNKSVSFIWNNISKIGGKKRGKPNKKIRILEREYFNILRQEIKILKPDIIIFTTGSSRDSYIKYHFDFGSEVEFLPKLCLQNGTLSKDTLNLIAEVKLPKFNKICAVRIEHPNRRTLKNSIILSVIKNIWERKENND
jgi:hypothetical protein